MRIEETIMNLKIKILIILLLWCFIPSLSWSFSFFSKKDVEYYKKHKDEAEDKLKACEMAIWSARGDIEAIEKIQNNKECIAAENAIKFLKKQEYEVKIAKRKHEEEIAKNKYKSLVNNYSKLSLHDLDIKEKTKCGSIGGGVFDPKYSKCRAIKDAKKIVYSPTVNKMSLLSLDQLNELSNNCTGDKYGFMSECRAVDEAKSIVLKNTINNKKNELSGLSDKKILELTYGPQSKCYNLNIKSIYCEAVRSLRKERTDNYTKLYLSNDQQRLKMYNYCNNEYKDIVKSTGSVLLDNRKRSDPLKCIAVSKARQLKGEDYRFYSR